MAKPEVTTQNIPWLDGEAQRQDAEAFEEIPKLGEANQDFICFHGKVSETVRRTALEVLVLSPVAPM